MNWFAVLVAICPGLVAGGFTYRVAVRTSRVAAQATASQVAAEAAVEKQRLDTERAKIDAEAYDRAKSIYEAALLQLEKQVARLQAQVERVEDLLTREQGTSDALRNQVATMRVEMVGLTGSVTALKGTQGGPDTPPFGVPRPE